MVPQQWVKIKPGQNLRADLSRRDLRLESELAESRARAWKRKQAGLLPLPENEHEGDQSDKTQLLKQITGDGMGTGCRRSAQPEHLARGPIPMAPIPEHQSEEDQLQQRVGRLRNWMMEFRFYSVLGRCRTQMFWGQASQRCGMPV
ncbi:hypothetical protein BY996DRAFT_6411806 [Phakopsora pachyrhizi]|nr:hypothetical protein BY996DRAFT_6411806 [Phakopsora pachyrhizi]